MPSRLLEERLTKCAVQPVGSCVHERIDKSTSAVAVCLRQVDENLPKAPLQLIHYLAQRMGFPIVLCFQLIGPECANDEDAAAGQLSPQMEEQTAGSLVNPLQVVERDKQGPSLRQNMQHVTELPKERCLLQRLRRSALAGEFILQGHQPLSARWRHGRGPRQQPLARYEGVEQLRAVRQNCLCCLW